MAPELIILGFVLMVLCAGLATVFMMAFYQGKAVKALIFKGLASLCFLIFGALNCFLGDISPTSVLIFVGLCLGIIGDELIALCQVFPEHDARAFIGGGSFFLIGHLIYMLSLLLIGEVNIIALIISAVLVAIPGGIYARYKKFLVGKMKTPLSIYIGIVILVTAVATGVLFARGSLGAGLFALGGLFFTFSDNLLFAYKCGENPFFKQNIALHVAYYLAQFCIAWSIQFL